MKLESLTQKQLLDLCGFMFGYLFYGDIHGMAELEELSKSIDLSDDERRIHCAARICTLVPLMEYTIALAEQTNINKYLNAATDVYGRDFADHVAHGEGMAKEDVVKTFVKVNRIFLGEFYKEYSVNPHLDEVKTQLKKLLKNNL